jgi:membrane protein YqaA with SNARE-associated domain
MLASATTHLLDALALPSVGLPTLFVISLLSSTILPMGSEPALLGLVKLNPDLLWPALLVASIGNTCGGAISYWMGLGAKKTFAPQKETRWFGWLKAYGPKTLLLSWLPIVGDPLCALAGWLKMPFWPCVAYMAIGKFLRYVILTNLLLTIPDHFWQLL